MQILVDTPTQLAIKIYDVEYSKPGKIINAASLVIFVVIFLHLINITQGHILAALLIALCVGSPIFLINCLWLGRQNKFFTFDQSLEKLVIERQSRFGFKVTCVLGIFLIAFCILGFSSKTKYTNIADVSSIFLVTLTLSLTALLLFGWFNLLFNGLKTKLIRRQYFFVSKVKVGEYWLRHINDVKIQCSSTVGIYGIVFEHCKIILSGALHIEMKEGASQLCENS